MYPRKPTFTILPAKHNLRNVILETKNSTKHLFKCSITFRQFLIGDTLRNIANIKKEALSFFEKDNVMNILKKKFSAVPENLRNQSSVIIRTWTHQCECVIAQRFRRGQQMFSLYSRLWEERALREFLQKMRQQVTRRGKELMLGAVGITSYNWNSNYISDNEIRKHVKDIEYMQLLKCNTLICNVCKNSNAKQNTNIGDLNCNCPHRKKIYSTYDKWAVFIEKEDMIVWRRQHECGSYEYKVYGSFNDVSAEDFLNVQIDVKYRKEWDNSAVILDVIEKDPNPESNSDIIYWEMLWPKFFANRDYVFKRRYLVDISTKTIILVNKCTEHPYCPITPGKHRVEDYFSHMVIRPYTDYNSPGLEFGLTYFDNPGINIPSAVTAWVAYRAMPEFLNRLREAAREYRIYCNKHGRKENFNVKSFIANELKKEKDQASKLTLERAAKETIVTTERCPGIEIMTSPSPILQTDVSKHTYWKYLQPTYYFS